MKTLSNKEWEKLFKNIDKILRVKSIEEFNKAVKEENKNTLIIYSEEK